MTKGTQGSEPIQPATALAQADAQVITLQRATRAGKRLADAADTIGHYYESIVKLEAENTRLLAERAELVAALRGLCNAKRPLDWSPSIELVDAFSHAREVLRKLGAE